ncbi:hypothetical protein GOP47_0027605 [Adiantum capillus-veneris]|nr:hypothetical protein GOP47_0027605 [Adiantum capillus-veneris]
MLPLRRAWSSTPLHRLRTRPQQRGESFSKLYYHVQSCGYEDVQVMWTMLHSSQHVPSSTIQNIDFPSLMIHSI